MAISATVSNHAKYQFKVKAINLATDSIKVILMRTGFVFNRDNHATYLNVTTTTGVANLEVNASLQYTRAAGSFVTNGFVPGNSITGSGFTNAGNNVVKVISTVTDTVITVTNTAGMIEETGGGGNETIVSEDELATGVGYTQDTLVLTGQVVTEDDSNNWGQMVCSDITWTAAGGNIGPTPGMMLYSDTSSDNTILGYLAFDGEQTATTGQTLTIQNAKIRIA